MMKRWALVAFVASLAGSLLATQSALSQEKKIEQMAEKGEFNADTPKDRDKTDCPSRLYALKCVAGRTYTIDMRSEDFDAYLRLEDPTGKTIKTDDDSGGGSKTLDARIVFKAEKTDTYRIAATSFNSAAKGKYTLTVTHDGAGKDEEITYLLDVKGKLTKDDPKDKERGGVCYFKPYKLEMSAKSTYVIHLESRDFDSYLRLLNAEGKEVAQDDDGAKDGLNAKLVFPCTATGSYTIIVTTHAHPDTGDYQLRVHSKK